MVKKKTKKKKHGEVGSRIVEETAAVEQREKFFAPFFLIAVEYLMLGLYVLIWREEYWDYRGSGHFFRFCCYMKMKRRIKTKNVIEVGGGVDTSVLLLRCNSVLYKRRDKGETRDTK